MALYSNNIDWLNNSNTGVGGDVLQYMPSTSSNSSFGNLFNRDNAGLALGALQGISALLGGFGGLQQNKMAKKQLNLARDQFAFQKDFANRNYANELSAFNTAMEDRINARAAQEGRDQTYVNDYLSRNQLRG